MLGFDSQLWVTSIALDEDVQKALVLCFSLRRSYTNRRIAVVASPSISPHLKEALYYAFDFVFFLDEALNRTKMNLENFSKLYCLLALSSFAKCAYLSPSMVVVKNCDDIFSKETERIALLEENDDASIFLFKPSIQLFKDALAYLVDSYVNGSGLGKNLKQWLKGEFGSVDILNVEYHNVFYPGSALIGFEKDILIINFINYPTGLGEFEKHGNTGLAGDLVAIYLKTILEDEVMPLLEQCTTGSWVFSSSFQLTSSALDYSNEPIAIVGMSCRYPGSNNLEEFWESLFQGQDKTCNPPSFRWMREQCSVHKADARKTNAGFLKKNVDEFDAKFFGVSPKEVLFMDPQHRLLHELVWEGLEDACIDPHSLRGTSGSVFLGSWMNEYKDIVMNSTIAEFYRVYMGNAIGAAAARISFLLGMTGPSISTESGCSSSMVAVHLACKSLRNGETNLALAGGVNLILHPFDKDLMPMVVSLDGHCKTFSDDANGFARAEGCGVLVLKRLSDALKDGDSIWALIRGTGVSQEGISKSMGTPTIQCESLAMQEALKDGDVRPEEVSYVEAHGTGTTVGDPMEVAAIARAYKSPLRKEPLVIGSVKTNVGHTESCSGITGIMKVVLAMMHETIPAHRNFTKLNPSIKLEAVPAVIPLQCLEWKKEMGKRRIAGVSSFGITGTDAHAIVEESPQISTLKPFAVDSKMDRPLQILKISAKTDEALNILLEKFQGYMGKSKESLSDIAYSLNCGRANFTNRVAIIAKSKQDVVASIKERKYLKEEIFGESFPKVCFLFTGQGSQYPGMAKQLYDCSPVFRMYFDYCDHILNGKYNISLKTVLWSDEKDSQDELSRTIYSQTSIFCVEYALFKLWESWGVKPDYALGHSLGEFAAAVCAGIISAEDAIMLVAERSRLIDELPGGKMLVVQADYNEVDEKMKRFLGNNAEKSLDYAAINSGQQTVVAGDSDVIMEFSKFLTEIKLKCIVLAATHAFHSKHMDPVLDRYRNVAKPVKRPTMVQGCEFISGMKGNLVASTEVDADYWVQHTREKVDFLGASKKAVELGCEIFIEIGPQPVLCALTMMNNESNLLCLPSLKRKSDDWDTILTTLGKMHLKGVEIDWSGLDQFYSRKKVRLPNYSFMGKKFWPDLIQVAGNVIHPLVGTVFPNASPTKLFQCGLNLRSNDYIKDHVVGQTVVFPGAGYLEMSLAAGLAAVEGSVDSLGKPSRPMKVENLMIKAPLALQESLTVQLQTVVELNTSQDNGNDWNDITVKIFHRNESDSLSKWLEHATAIFSPIPTAEEQQGIEFDRKGFFEILAEPQYSEESSQIYQKLASAGLKFGPAFRSIENVWRNDDDGTMLAKVKIPQEDNGASGEYVVHPVVLDAMIQAIMMKNISNKTKVKLCVPIKIGKLLWLSNGTEESGARYIHVLEKPGSNRKEAIALLLDSNATVLAVMSGVELIDTTVKAVEAVLEQQISKMPDLWEESWHPKLGPSQYRHDLSLYIRDNFYDDKFRDELHENFNKTSPELEKTVLNLEHLVFLNYVRCLYECGWKPALTDVFTEDDIRKMLNIQPEFSKLFGHILHILKEEGVLHNTDKDIWQVLRLPPTMSQVQKQLSSSHLNDDLVKQFNCTLILQKVGVNYSKILTGVQAALPVLFSEEGPSVVEFYRDHGRVFKTTKLGSSVRTQHLKYFKRHYTSSDRKLLRVLEIGAGTGTSTINFIEDMLKVGIEFDYTFTDISPAFFVAAEELLEPYMQHIKFQKLNIEEDPITQGFTPNYYDWILASDVIHATKNLEETFSNVRNLLRDGGTFDMVEQTKVNRMVTHLFGLLDGFWRFEDLELRPNHCTLSTEKWIETLQNGGFQLAGSFPCLNNAHTYISSYKCPKLNDMIRLEFGLSGGVRLRQKIWILFHFDDSHVSNYLLRRISALDNRQVVVVQRGERFNQLKTNEGWRYKVDQESEQDFFQLMNRLESNGEIEGIMWCWSLDKSCATQDVILRPYFYMIKSVLKLKQSQSPKITAFVNGVVPVVENDLSCFHTSTIWGFVKALRNERIELAARSVDIGGKEDAVGVAEQAFYELWNEDIEAQVAYHENARYIPKIKQFKPSLLDLKLPSGSERFQLALPETNAIEDLRFRPMDPTILEATEVEVVVKASALNFRDVFSVLKPSDDFKDMNSVGFDFSGVVKRVGSKVTKWAIGDSVFGVNLQNSALPSHLKLDENDLCPVPNGMTLPDACTLPAVYATSYYCLIDVANVTAHDTVLIHTASGGVGLSAIRICKSIGAKIIATAGNKRKRNYLKSLGIQHVFHSRNTNYGEEILRVTDGFGVNVVLNSLTSEGFKEATLRACAKGARFVEMSKLSIWQPEDVKKLRPDVQYTIVDLSSMNRSEWNRLMGELLEMAANKVAKPIPYVRFDSVHIREALHYLQKAKHIGKVVCVMPEVKQKNGMSEIVTPMFNAGSTYLITGGLGGIGFVVCQWMVDKGARHVLLAGRNPPPEIIQQSIDKLNNEYRAHVQAVQLDVSDFTQCEELFQNKIATIGFPALRGVMHAAGTLNDGLIENQTWETLSSTFKSKVTGTLNLHELTKDLNLEFFVLFSSLASLFGSPGQSNHSAGNNFEDAFAHYRHSMGLPATSVNWGQWGEVGIATEADLPGIKPFSNMHGIAGLEYVLKSQRTQTGVINIDSFTLMAKLYPYISSVLDERLWKSASFSLGANSINLNSGEFWQQYNSLKDIDSRKEYLRDLLRCILRNILKLDVIEVIEDNANFQEMGVDSLMFVEIKNAVQHLVGERAVVNTSALRDCNTITSFADVLVKIVEGEDLKDSIPSAEEVAQLIQEDCQLAEHIKSKPDQNRIDVKNISTVLVTGCSGTLGVYILRELTNNTQVKHVICLLQPNKKMTADDRLKDILEKREILSQIDMIKVRCVTGNVAEFQFGMDTSLWEELNNEVDAIYHCAAKVNHVEHYKKRDHSIHDVRKVNVGGLKNVLEFACTGDKLKHVYCASSMLSVRKLKKDGSIPEEWLEPNLFDGVTTLAYPISKYVEDMLMKQAITERGIPGKVFRFPFIMGDSETGKFILENNHVMLRYIFILKSGIMPVFPLPLPFMSVDICAWALTQISLNPDAPDDVYNVCNKCPDLDQDFIQVAKRLGCNVDLVDFYEFNKEIRAFAAQNPAFGVFEEFYRNDDEIMSFYSGYELLQWAVEGGSDKSFMVSKKIAKILPEFYSESNCSRNELYRDMLYAKKQGWFEKFGIIENIPVNSENTSQSIGS